MPLVAGGPTEVAFGVALPIGILSMGSSEGHHLLSLEDHLGTSVGETVVVGCSSMGEVLCNDMSGGNRGVCSSRRWYEAASELLSNGRLLNKTA